MKKYILIAAGVLVLAGGAITYAYVNNSMEADRQNAEQEESSASGEAEPDTTEATETETTDSADSNSTENATDEDSTQASPGAYVNYSSSAVASADGTKLLFFHAPWCPQCQMVDADIKSDGVPDGVTVFKVDYDSNQALRKKYGVTLQTTFVKIDANGNEIKKYVAYNEPTFDSVKANLL